MNMKRLLSIILCAALMFALASCGSAPVEEPVSEVVTEPVQEEPAPEVKEPEVVEEKQYLSALTGLPVKDEATQNRRPVAIMINNIKQALPQSGIANAGIIFEALAEGGVTRMLAVFDDYEALERIGTIRSARAYYLDFAQSLDAIFVHIGGSPEAYTELQNRKMDSFDLIQGSNSGVWWRDEARIKNNGYEHSAYTSGSRLTKKIADTGMRATRTDAYSNVFNFSNEANYSGTDATNISAQFSNYKTGTYTYDAATGLYKVGQFGKEHIDELTNEQIAFKNIFVLHMNSYVIKGDDKGRLRFDSVGSGNGKYFVNGTAVDITWKRDSKSGPFKFYTSDGADLKTVPGNSYVAIVPLKAKVTVQ